MSIGIIRNKTQHKKYLARIEELWGAKGNTPEGNELDVLMILVDTYERAHLEPEPPDPIHAIVSNRCGACGGEGAHESECRFAEWRGDEEEAFQFARLGNDGGYTRGSGPAKERILRELFARARRTAEIDDLQEQVIELEEQLTVSRIDATNLMRAHYKHTLRVSIALSILWILAGLLFNLVYISVVW